MANAISIKGTRDGLTITMSSGDLGVLIEDLASHLRTQGQFFRGGRVAVRLGGRLVSREDLERLAALLEEHQMVLRTVITADEGTAAAAEAMGLHVLADGPIATAPSPLAREVPVEPVESPSEVPTPDRGPETAGEATTSVSAKGEGGAEDIAAALPREGTPSATARTQAAPAPVQPVQPAVGDADRAFLIRRNVRSGQVIRHTGHVVIVGDVNPGAEVWATGDVIIWGRLRGTVRAGSSGNSEAMICALEMRPSQLRIGDAIARPADSDTRARPYPEVARVRNGTVVVEPWATGRGI